VQTSWRRDENLRAARCASPARRPRFRHRRWRSSASAPRRAVQARRRPARRARASGRESARPDARAHPSCARRRGSRMRVSCRSRWATPRGRQRHREHPARRAAAPQTATRCRGEIERLETLGKGGTRSRSHGADRQPCEHRSMRLLRCRWCTNAPTRAATS
jgi:hypothetical protein